jgi:pyruvate ferredoxin oxidoreductase gamma subunit
MHAGAFETRIHGRGGQGVVTAAELLAVAAFAEGRHAQAFPTFGSERTGAPVVAYCRIDERPIRSREPVIEPDALVVQDPTLLHQVDLFAGVGEDSYVLINTARTLEELGLDELRARLRPERLLTIPATELARDCVGRPLPNAPLLGAFAELTGAVQLDSVVSAIRARFPTAVAERNVAAARRANALARTTPREITHA